tara:strand:- start:79 stop:393 length:315 start_codon:yes stop_codon:yes gene_type:complete
MKLKPVHDKIVVKPMEKNKEETTDSGIILPDTVDQGKLLEGEVVAAGNVIYSTSGDAIPIVVEVGDRILYSKHAQTQEYKLDGEEVLIMSQNEVLSILELENED